jgi:hypothetical protein
MRLVLYELVLKQVVSYLFGFPCYLHYSPYLLSKPHEVFASLITQHIIASVLFQLKASSLIRRFSRCE